MIDADELERRFNHHPADTDYRQVAHEYVRASCLQLAFRLDATVPDGREKDAALHDLEQVMFWANAGLARQDQ